MKFTSVFMLIIGALSAHAQNITSTKMSSCDKKATAEYVKPFRLIKKEVLNDTLHLKVGIVRHCSFYPEVNLKKSNDSLFIEFKDVSEIYTFCDCCYELDILATNVKDTNFKLIIGLYAELNTKKGFEDSLYYREIVPHENKYIFPTPEEFDWEEAPNEVNANGQKVGRWILYRKDSDKIHAKVYYQIKGEGISEISWAVIYDETGEIIELLGSTELWSIDSVGQISMNREEYFKFLEEKIKNQ